MGYLTTHVLDTATGRPASGMSIQLFAVDDNETRLLKTVVTNDDGRVDGAVLTNEEFACGTYELHFQAGDYLKAQGADLPTPLFLDVIPIRFGIADVDAHYHVPLLLSPFGYSTYRGS